jgi:N-acetylmuramoyl-L-alanine amidase/outer membrane protein OmpA-like peptidoglycan-associated protein/GH25 family lysozyme M1 (1,4-beta-N-acetylmuramidase)/subtilisin family serine protease
MGPDLVELFEDGNGDDEVAAIIRLGHYGTLPKGVRVVTQFSEIITIRTTRANIPKVSGAAEVADIAAGDTYMGPDVESVEVEDIHLEALGLAELSSDTVLPTDQRRPPDETATGKGVIIGVVDWGFDFFHRDFLNKDGTTRILALWDQRGSKLPNSPQPFGYGVVHDSAAINRALKEKDPYAALGYHPADADTGIGCHGTHVLSIAAGSGGDGRPAGIAPEADIIVVHNAPWDEVDTGRLGDSVTLLEGIDFIARTAGDRPWVINLSMGRHGEQHDGSTLIEQGLDAAIRSAPGRAICLSAGNYFDKRIHASGQLRPTQERKIAWEILEGKPTYNQLEFWYSWQDKFEVEVRSPDGSITARAKVGDRAKFMLGGKEVGNVYHRAQEPNNLDNHITIYLYKEAPAGEWEVTIIGTDVIDGHYHAWVERDVSCPKCQSRLRAADADPKSTTGTICNGKRTLAVGAYSAHDPEMRLGHFSSVGPTRDGRLKPDLCAPGVSVLAARSAPREKHDPVQLLTRMSGTSMAAPHVTGTVALMFQAAPRKLRIEETHNLLLQSARKVSVPEEIPERIGIGFLDVEDAVEAARKIRGAGSTFNQTTVHASVFPRSASGGRESNAEAEFHEIFDSGSSQSASEIAGETSHADFVEQDSTDGQSYGGQSYGEMDAELGDSEMQSGESACRCAESVDVDAASDVDAEQAESEQAEIEQAELEQVEASESEASLMGSRAYDSQNVQAVRNNYAEMADQIVAESTDNVSRVPVLHEMLSRTGSAENLLHAGTGALPEAADVFDTITYNLPGRFREQLGQSLEVVALPGTSVHHLDLREGDIGIRRGEGELAHSFVIAEPKLRNLEAVLSEGITPESLESGNYATVIETGPRPHTTADQFARSLTDGAGRLLNDLLILRLAAPPPPTVISLQQSAKPAEPAGDTIGHNSESSAPWECGETDPGSPAGSGALNGAAGLSSQLAQAVQTGAVSLEVGLAILAGQRDVNALTNSVFYAHHPELAPGQKIQSTDVRSAQDWMRIREQVIKPLLQHLSPSATSGAQPGPQTDSLTGPLFLGLDDGDVDENRNPDWNKAKVEGPISFAIIRAHTGWRADFVFKREWPRMKDAGIVRGAYLFLSFPNHKYSAKPPDPLAQVEGFIRTVGDLEESDFPPSLDVEFPGNWTATGMTQPQLLDKVRVAWRALKEHYKVAPLIYTSARVWREDLANLPAPDLFESPLWLTPYPFGIHGPAVRDPQAFAPGGRYKPPPVPKPWGDGNWWIHQYQGDAQGLPGFRQVDMNRFNPMTLGATGERVKWVQRRLGISQSGSFDAATQDALRAFQDKRRLAANGEVDPRTFAFLCWSNPHIVAQSSDSEWEGDGDTKSPAYIRWLQQALNTVDQAGLVVDGNDGARTRGAVRRFQSKHPGLTADGEVGPKTEAALIAAGADPPPGQSERGVAQLVSTPVGRPVGGRVPDTDVPCPRPAIVLDRFAKNKFTLIPEHFPIIANVARRVVASRTEADPVHEICIGGHTDNTGNKKFNDTLGRQRAESVEAELFKQIALLSPGLENQLGRFIYSSGADEPIASNDTDSGRQQNRRAEIYLNSRYRSDTQTTTVRIDVLSQPNTVAFKEQNISAEAPNAAQTTANPAVFLLSEDAFLVSTGAPLPVGNPAYVWTSLDPDAVLVALADGTSQTHPSKVLVRGAKAVDAEVQVTYKPSAGPAATTTRRVAFTNINTSLLDPEGCDCASVNELVRSLIRSDVAHRTVKFALQPASFWAGRRVRLTFAVTGAQRGALSGAHANNIEPIAGFAFAAGVATLTANGTTAVRINMPPVPLNGGTLRLTSVDFPNIQSEIDLEVAGRVVIDPGHGGSVNLPGASSNNATSVSNVLEKDISLDLGRKVRDELNATKHIVHVLLTRDGDFNISGGNRASVARWQRADTFMSIHLNSDANAATRGTEVFVRSVSNGNVNRAEDLLLANRLNTAIVGAVGAGGKSRGVKDDTATKPGSLAVLSDTSLGNTAADHPIRSCLAEIEFITNVAADQLLNGPNKEAARTKIAKAIGAAIIADLESRA